MRRAIPIRAGRHGFLAQRKMTEPNSSDLNTLEQAIIDIAIEGWRFARLFTRAISKMDAGESNRYVSQLRYYQKRVSDTLESAGFRIVNVEGQLYDPGIAASAINIGDFGPDDKLMVEQMVEPIIMGESGLRRQGAVMLKRIEQ
jgi:hypothetical protein